jgi:hypothetical protein
MNTPIKPKSLCYGITNKTQDGLYILFADYDNIYFHTLLKELDSLIKTYPSELTNFAIYETRESIQTPQGVLGSYHVINFAKMPYANMREKLAYLSVDDLFFKLPKRVAYRSNTLRISPKFKYFKELSMQKEIELTPAPRFVCFYPTHERLECSKRKVSSAHLNAYQVLLGLPKFRMMWSKREDELKVIELKKYYSLKE